MDTVELRKKLNTIKSHLQKATYYASGCAKVFEEMKPEILNTEEDYDFEDFKDLVIFDKSEKENTDKEKTIDRQFKFIKMKSNIDESMKRLDERRTRLYDSFMSKMKMISHQTDALSSVNSFLEHWNKKTTDNYELRDYPDTFLKCLNKIPSSCRAILVKELSTIKCLPGTNMNVSKVFNDSNESNQRIPEFVIPSYRCKEFIEEASKRENTFFDNTLLKTIDGKKKDDYVRGNTMKLGISVMDYTINPDNDVNLFRKCSTDTNNESFDMKDVQDLNASVLSNDILNQAIHEDIEDDTEPRFANNHDFSVVDSSNPEMNDDDYPEIEKIATTSIGFNSFDITLDQSANISYPIRINDSLKTEDEESISIISEGRSRRLNETEYSVEDVSNLNFGYSFNNSNVPLQDDDDDYELDDDDELED